MGKRILITSISSWCQISGADTWSTLFSFANPKDVASIYIDPRVPDSNVASRYFNISESLVLKSIFNRKIKTGREVVVNKNVTSNGKTNSKSKKFSLDFFKTHRSFLFLWLRELAWCIGKWNSQELNSFLHDYNADVFVISISSYPYINRINEYIIDKYKPKKVVAFLWDDNFTYKQFPRSLTFKIERYFLRKQVRRIIKKSDKILAISPKMKAECDKEFGVDSIILTKPIFNQNKFIPYKVSSPIRILYTGSLVIGRDKTIAALANAIEEVNKSGLKVILDVYSNSKLTDKQRNEISISGCCVLHDAIPQTKALELQKEADVLLFVESLSDKNLTARLSFSTKLTDYFSAGKCIWAIGNKDLGPIAYLKDEDAGLVSTSYASLKKTLNEIIEQPTKIEEYANKAFNCGKRNHDGHTILNKLSKDVIDY